MSTAPDPIQQQLVAARRAQILDAATRVFAYRGFHQATIRDVAQAAGIADGTIYNYFANKADLLMGILDRLNETQAREEHFTDLEAEDFAVFLRAYLRHRLAVLWPNAAVFRAVLPEMLVNAELRERYQRQVIAPTMAIAERYLQAQVDRGRMRRVDVPLTVRALAAALLGLLVLYLLGDEQVAARWEALPDALATLVLEGLQPPPVGV